MKNVRSSQPCLSMNFLSKAQFLPHVSIVKIFAKSPRKHLRQSLPCNFIKKENVAQVFSWNFCEIFNNTSGRLLLKFIDNGFNRPGKAHLHLHKNRLSSVKFLTIQQNGYCFLIMLSTADVFAAKSGVFSNILRT